jgi:hypothetical protein
MASQSYQELLAETYRETKDLQEDFTEEEEEPDIDGHQERDYDVSEVADQDAFKKFAGNRGHPETIPKPAQFTDKGKNSIRYEKDIQIYINSPGGSVTSGLAIYDTMQQVNPDIVTICYGLAASMRPSSSRVAPKASA